MKILHYVDEANLAWAKPWIQLLLQLEKKGCENIVLCPPNGSLSRFLEDYSIPHMVAEAWTPWLPAGCRKVRKAIDSIRPHILHTRLSSAARIGGYWGKRLGIPVVSTIDKYPKKKYYMNSDMIVGCSAAVSRHMENTGFPAEKIVTIHNPVDVEYYCRDDKTRESFRKKSGLRDDESLFLGLGRFIDWKAFDILIRACARISSSKKWKLWLVGDGPDREKLHGLVSECNMDGSTVFWGYAEDVRPYMWAADLFVQPSNKPEGFSLALLEAMASGLPVAATKIGGTLDILCGGDEGQLFAVDDVEALRGILERFLALPKGEKDRMGRNAANVASRFSTSVIAGRYAALYEKILVS